MSMVGNRKICILNSLNTNDKDKKQIDRQRKTEQQSYIHTNKQRKWYKESQLRQTDRDADR